MSKAFWFEVVGERIALLANEKVVVVEGCDHERETIEASSPAELAAYLKEDGKASGVDVAYSHEIERGETAFIRADEGVWVLATKM